MVAKKKLLSVTGNKLVQSHHGRVKGRGGGKETNNRGPRFPSSQGRSNIAKKNLERISFHLKKNIK